LLLKYASSVDSCLLDGMMKCTRVNEKLLQNIYLLDLTNLTVKYV